MATLSWSGAPGFASPVMLTTAWARDLRDMFKIKSRAGIESGALCPASWDPGVARLVGG